MKNRNKHELNRNTIETKKYYYVSQQRKSFMKYSVSNNSMGKLKEKKSIWTNRVIFEVWSAFSLSF